MQDDPKLPESHHHEADSTPRVIEHAPTPDATIDESEPAVQAQSNRKERKVLIAPHKHFIRFWKWWLGLNRNERFAFLAALLLVFGAAAILWFGFIHPNSNPGLSIIRHQSQEASTTVASPLSGVQVSPAQAARPVTAVMIENSDFARPQSGLQDAGIVYEAIAEGGVTRFMALFQDTAPKYIGPVRSLRPYYIDFAAPFQASIAHVGGSPDALSRVRNGHYRDIDEFFNAGAYWRISSREAPHNVYTSFAKLDALNKSKGYKHSDFTPWPRKADQKLKVPTAKTIDIHISGPDYYVHYDYDASTNTYKRSEGGEKHMDTTSTGKQVRLAPKVVVTMVVPETNGKLDATGAYYSDYSDVGSGRVFVFQDGGRTVGTWKKTSQNAPLSFWTADGQPLKLDAGQTWITLVSSSGLVNYSNK